MVVKWEDIRGYKVGNMVTDNAKTQRNARQTWRQIMQLFCPPHLVILHHLDVVHLLGDKWVYTDKLNFLYGVIRQLRLS